MAKQSPLETRKKKAPAAKKGKQAKPVEPVYTASETARLVDESPSNIVKAIQEGRIRSLPRIGKKYRVPQSEIDRLTGVSA